MAGTEAKVSVRHDARYIRQAGHLNKEETQEERQKEERRNSRRSPHRMGEKKGQEPSEPDLSGQQGSVQ